MKSLYILLLCGGTYIVCRDKVAYIVPFYENETEAQLFDVHARDDAHKVWCDTRNALQKHGYRVELNFLRKKLPKHASVLVCDVPIWAKGWQKQLPKDRRHTVLYLWEPPVIYLYNYQTEYHREFGTVATMFDNLVAGNPQLYKKCYFPHPYMRLLAPIVPFAQRKFATMIIGVHHSSHPSQLYTKRWDVISYFTQHAPSQFDFYGKGWERFGLPTYKGSVAHKAPVLRNYKFVFCYENMGNQNGYITEKMLDVLSAGSVPVYWGADNIERYVPRGCFIDARKYKTVEQLYEALHAITEEEYNQYIANIQKFLASDAAFYFSIPYFIHTMLSSMLPDYDPKLIFDQVTLEKLYRVLSRGH